jgi:Transcriptional regulators
MASQKDIARLAQVSQSVVSRVLNGRARDFGISEDTIARIRAIADALDYQPNQVARMLLGRETRLVAVIVRSFEDHFLGTMLEELNARALAAGYTLLVVGFKDGQYNWDEIRLLQSYRPDAFIVVGSTDFASWDKEFLSSGKLIIQVGKPTDDERIISCGTDEAAAARLLVDHLVGLGHATFGIVGDATAVSRLRTQALKQALRERGLAAPPSYSYLSDQQSIAAGTDAGAYFSQDRNRTNWPTAIVATGDLIALSFIRRIAEDGVTVPDFVSVASYNDIVSAALSRPSLTTIRQPVRRLAAASMDIVIGNAPRKSIVLPPELAVRESTAPPRH